MCKSYIQQEIFENFPNVNANAYSYFVFKGSTKDRSNEFSSPDPEFEDGGDAETTYSTAGEEDLQSVSRSKGDRSLAGHVARLRSDQLIYAADEFPPIVLAFFLAYQVLLVIKRIKV